MATSLASTIALTIENEREIQLADVLVDLGLKWDLEQLLDTAVEKIPKLVPGTGCSIFLRQENDQPHLQLAGSSREGLIDADEHTAEVSYTIGEGKTGFCALAGATLVVNHFGPGERGRYGLNAEIKRIHTRYPEDFVEMLRDEVGSVVGLIQLRRGSWRPKHVEPAFDRLTDGIVYSPDLGLLSPVMTQLAYPDSPTSRSFVAVPIAQEGGETVGVVTIGRPGPRHPFSPRDVTFLEAIASRMAALIHIFRADEERRRLVEERERLLITIAHEINTPLTGILADSENLMYELESNEEHREIAQHTLEQVQRLQLLTDTIMMSLSGETPQRQFSQHSIYGPLKEACEMFASEAKAKGCDIVGPMAVPHGSSFPDIEMSRFDLVNAFKNILHNAIKYSYHSIKPRKRTYKIVVKGFWANREETEYSVSVQNYGIGLAPEEIDQGLVFDPYYRGKQASERQRTGAGLV